MSTLDFDVLVVGAGPVGLVTARELGRLGHRVGVLERHPTPYPLPRAVAFDFEIGRYFGKLGIADEVRAISQPVTDSYQWKNRDLELLVGIPWNLPGPSGWPVTSMFSQPELEQVLRDTMPQIPNVTMLPGNEVVELFEYDEHVELKTRRFGTDDPTESLYTAGWVVGCDGANSFIRESMGTPVKDLGFFFDWLICDVVPRDDIEWSPINWQMCDPKRPTTIVSGGPGRRRWEFMLLPGESADTMNREDVAWELLGGQGRTPENSTLERHAVYRFQARWAEQWRRDRLIIAGDAAHQMPPFAGQGMCSGLRDALNLSWKLDLVIRDKAEESLLDTYSSERVAHLQNAIQFSIALGNVICILDEDEARARDERMIAGGADPAKVLPPPAPPTLGPGVTDCALGAADLTGNVSPQFQLVVDGSERWSDELIGTGWTVFGTEAALRQLSPDSLDLLAQMEGTLICTSGEVPDGAVAAEISGPFASLMADSGIDILVVRPDFYVYGSAVSSHADELVSGISSHLRPASCPA